MTIEPIKGKGVNRANAVCDDCGRREVATCDYTRDSGGTWHPNEGQVHDKVCKHGWALVKGKLRCPSCEAKRKVVPMKAKEEPKAEDAPREPSRQQKREIMLALDEYYDTEGERYRNGETDETIAEMCEVMPGWVSRLREEFYGPDGGNESIEELMGRLAQAETEIKAVAEAASQQHDKAEKKLAEVSAMRAELDRIKKAVGPRALQRAKA